MNDNAHSDLRHYARFEFMECALLYQEGRKEPYRAMLVDIGLGGVQLRSKDQLPVSEICMLEIGQDGGTPLSLRGQVRYCRPVKDSDLYTSGFKFAPDSHEQRVLIAEYVHGVFQRQGEILAG